MMRQPAQHGFTLVELLVVISIIALLITILLPVLGHARETGLEVVCKSNQRQLALATSTYQIDHHGRFPQPGHDSDITDQEKEAQVIWFNALDAYLSRQSRQYHSAKADERNYDSYKQDPVWENYPGDQRQRLRTIKMNAYLGNLDNRAGLPPVWFYTQEMMKQPSNTVVYADGRGFDTPSVTTGNTGGSDRFHATEIYVGLRHDDGANVVFGDAHVEIVKQAIRETSAGYRGWYDGSNGGPQELVWRLD